MNETFTRYRRLALLAGGMLLVLLAIIPVQRRMNAIIVEKRLTDADPIENAPPIIAFTTVALGSFRGLLANFLWLRAMSLQDEGKYFEMVQLASWITKLQPRFTGATAYLAWNMAYNISVTCSDHQDRWRWVQRGIELIRDEAIQYNPGDPQLYKELGWIYQHKIGNVMDDAHNLYKIELAMTMMKAFGGDPAPDWTKLAEAPKTQAQLEAALGGDDDSMTTAARDGFASLAALEKAFREGGGKIPPELAAKLRPESKELIEDYLRAKWLREVYKLEPLRVLEINQRYGELDWRLAFSHSIYWATIGLEVAPDNKDVHCERMIAQALADSFRGGRLLMVGENERLLTIPNLNVADAVRDSHETAHEHHGTQSFEAGLENFLKDAVVKLFTFGNYTKAQEYLDDLRLRHPANPVYRAGIDAFVMREWAEDVREATMQQAQGLVSGLLYSAYLLLAYGDERAAEAHIRLARFVHARYQQSVEGSIDRVGLPEFTAITGTIVRGCLANFPPMLAENLRLALESRGETAILKAAKPPNGN